MNSPLRMETRTVNQMKRNLTRNLINRMKMDLINRMQANQINRMEMNLSKWGKTTKRLNNNLSDIYISSYFVSIFMSCIKLKIKRLMD